MPGTAMEEISEKTVISFFVSLSISKINNQIFLYETLWEK